MQRIKNKHKLFILIISLILFFSCKTIENRYKSEISFVSLKGKEGQALVTLTEYSNSKGEIWAELTSSLIEGITIKGSIEKENDQFTFYITGAHLFSNWNNGWTDAQYEASGIYVFKTPANNRDQLICNEIDPFELWDIIAGEIRLNETFYRGNDGVWKVKNRIDRIVEVTKWIKSSGRFPNIYGDRKKETVYSPPFRDDMKLFLFPEMLNFNKLKKESKLTEEYYRFMEIFTNRKEFKNIKSSSFGLTWRMDYTEAVFPKEFRELRNTSTIWRDFEEAPEIFLGLYNIDTFFETIVKNKTFRRN